MAIPVAMVTIIKNFKNFNFVFVLQMYFMQNVFKIIHGERSGLVVECLTRDRGSAGSSLTGVTALCP